MNRKQTILIAVLINAGLLALLFIAAVTTQSDSAPALPETAATPSELKAPLFSDNAPQIPLIESTAMHQLPPLAIAEPQEIPLAAPVVVQQQAPEPMSIREVTVKKGDTLEKIAKAQGVPVDEIIKLNRLPSSFLRVGQVLKLPAARALAAAPKVQQIKSADRASEYYTVKVGDNPWTIATRHHLKVEELLRLNGLNEEKARKLKPGDRLRTR